MRQFRTQHGKNWQVTWDKKSGTPLSVFAGTTEPVPGSPEKVARLFLKENRSLFNMKKGLKDLKLKEVNISSRGIRHVRFQQIHNGIPVYEGGYQVHIRPDGRIDMANGNYYTDIEVSTSPSLSTASAIQTVESDLGSQIHLKKKPETKLMIFRNTKDETFALAWNIMISEKGVHWQYFINATNGQVIEKMEMATSITGDGNIIEETPCTTPNSVNESLYRLDGSGYLRGTYANVHNEENSRAFSSVNSFQYGSGNTHFEEVNVYYHIDDFRHNYLNNIGFAGENIGSDKDLEAFVHDPNYNANYIFNQEAVRFSSPPDFALQDEVIYHEFTHAAADAVNGSHRLDPNSTEEGAIGEGTADYFAGSYTGDAQIGDCVLPQPRDMNGPGITSYGNYQNNLPVAPHDGGEFFSAILWDLRNAGGISPHHADEIIFGAISRLSGGPNFIGFRDAMMAEDNFIHGGNHNNLIQDTFAGRGIGNFSPLDVSISGPLTIDAGEWENWSVSASNGSGSYSFTWYQKPNSSSTWSQIGTGTSVNTTEYKPFQLRVEAADNGNPKTGFDTYGVLVEGIHP